MTFAVAACGGDDGGSTPLPGTPDASVIDGGGGMIDAMPTDMIDAAPRPDAAIVKGVVISEVVTSPLNDWSVSGSDNEDAQDFDGSRGNGAVSSRDQFIEIHNRSGTVVNLLGWRLEVIDSSSGTPELTPIAPSNEEGTVVTFSAGSILSAVQPDGFVVVGNPAGTVGPDAYIVLKDSAGQVIDDVEIGINDREGDGDEDGAPGPNQNGYANGSFEESIARPAGSEDTDNDRNDFTKLYATPLAPNVAPAKDSGDTTAPIATLPDAPDTDSWPVTSFVRVDFGEQLDASVIGSSDITLSVDGNSRPVQRFAFEAFDSVVVLETRGVLPFGADVSVDISTNVTDYAGNSVSAASLSFRTEDPAPNGPTVLINEVCVQAQQDWNHSSDSGEGFARVPGTDATDVSSSDEWIELLINADAAEVIDLTGYTLELFNGPQDGEPAVFITEIDDHSEVVPYGLGTFPNALNGGTLIVVGNPRGSMNDDVYIALRDADGNIVDEVEIGGNDAESDVGGDGIENGAPGVGLNGDGNDDLSAETVSRIADTDTGDDLNDWVPAAASLGVAN